MRTLPALLRSSRHALARLADEGSESGVTLIEVVISALLVAVIAIGTLTGFDSAGRAVGDERQHAQATTLAAQDEERLRGMNVTELGRYGAKTYTVKENGTTYTIEARAQFVSAAKEAFTCETEGSADYIQTTSKVTWPALTSSAAKREAVSQSSIVPVPTSDSLLVNVHNQANEAVEGATVRVTGKTSGATYEQITPESGCVIFGALSDNEVVIVVSKAGWINEELQSESSQEAKLATTSLVSKTFVIAAEGTLKAEFESNGTTAGVQGDTVHVAHTSTPEKAVGTAGSPVASISIFPLFPFQTPGNPPTESKYTVYAGECSSSDPAKVNSAELKDPTPAQVNPGVTTSVKVEVPQLKTEVYEGSSSSNKGSKDSNAEVKLTDVCGTTRTMKTSLGALEHPYQPYGKTKFCVTQVINSKRYKYSTELTLNSKAGYSMAPVYMSSSSYQSLSGC
jgi:Tfp pilus assembly protein PilV